MSNTNEKFELEIDKEGIELDKRWYWAKTLAGINVAALALNAQQQQSILLGIAMIAMLAVFLGLSMRLPGRMDL